MTVTVVNPMQRDIELFEEFDLSQKTEPIFFFYTWDKPAITLGKVQRGREELIAEAEALGLDCFLRPTGGKAVLHGGDICYSFIGAQADPIYGGKLRDSFKAVNQMVIKMVNEVLGLNCFAANAAHHDERLSEHNCFGHQVCNEGIVDNHKIIGAAQAMAKRAFIQQGSIQLNPVAVDLDYFKSQKTLGDITGQTYDLASICKLFNMV